MKLVVRKYTVQSSYKMAACFIADPYGYNTLTEIFVLTDLTDYNFEN